VRARAHQKFGLPEQLKPAKTFEAIGSTFFSEFLVVECQASDRHISERHITECIICRTYNLQSRYFVELTNCRTDILSNLLQNRHFVELSNCRTDILSNLQIAEQIFCRTYSPPQALGVSQWTCPLV
jgi:hypothetical protein